MLGSHPDERISHDARLTTYDAVMVADPRALDACEQSVLLGLVPTMMVVGLPSDSEEAAQLLGVQPASFFPMPDGALQADFRIPRKTCWRLWLDRGAAIWIGTDAASSRPPVIWNWQPVVWELSAALHVFARQGLWLQNARVLRADHWSEVVPASVVIEALGDARAIAGTWSDVEGRSVRLVIFDDGRLWGESPVEAERWLLAAGAAATS